MVDPHYTRPKFLVMKLVNVQVKGTKLMLQTSLKVPLQSFFATLGSAESLVILIMVISVTQFWHSIPPMMDKQS